MCTFLLLSLLGGLPIGAAAQTQPPPAQPAPARRPAPQARTTLSIVVTDASGAALEGISVEITGPVDRGAATDQEGSVRFVNMRAGTYRARFSGDEFITFEKEIVVRAGQAAEVEVALNPSINGPPEEARPPSVPITASSPPPSSAVGPAAQPKTMSVVGLVEKEFIGRQPRRESMVGCTGNARVTVIQLNEQQPERLYENAESMYYVVAGEGTIRINGRETPIANGTLSIVPRGASHAFLRRGRGPLVLLAVLSGEPCAAAI